MRVIGLDKLTIYVHFSREIDVAMVMKRRIGESLFVH